MHPGAHIKTRKELAHALNCIFDANLYRVLSEPIRVDLIKHLITNGEGDIGTIAEAFPVDRSVISRHLQKLEEHELLISRREGRHRYYRVDLDCFIESFEESARLLKQLRRR